MESVEHTLASHDLGASRQMELKDLVDKALEKLDYRLRIPLVLNIYAEMDLFEIAGIMCIPEGTVKSRLFTARKNIREYLDSIAQ